MVVAVDGDGGCDDGEPLSLSSVDEAEAGGVDDGDDCPNPWRWPMALYGQTTSASNTRAYSELMHPSRALHAIYAAARGATRANPA